MKMTRALDSLFILILIFFVTCKEENLIKPGEEFHPFISIPNYGAIQENIQVLNEIDPQSYADDSPLNLRIKCLSLFQYSVYDIKGLGENSLDEKIGEVAHTTKVKIGEKDYTILYNFCYDLKKTERCNSEEGRQIALLENDQCKYIANGIGKGNLWKFIPKTNSSEEQIEIEVNKLDKNSFKYILTCDPNGEKQKHQVTNAEGKINNEGGMDITLEISTKEACKKVDFYFIYKFTQDYKILFVILLILFGIFNCGFGKRFSRFTAFFLCIIICVVFILILSQYVLPSGCKEWIIWVMFGVGIILGVTAGVFAFKYHEGCMAFLTGGIGGFFLGQFLYSFFGHQIPANGIVMNIVFIVVSIGALIAVAFFFKKFIVIFATSLIGSYCLIRGISLVAGKFPDEMTVIDLRTRGEDEQLKALLTWQVYVYLAAIAVATVLSMIIQYKTYKEDPVTDSDSKDANNMRTAE
jgi:hypothetical protein